MTNETRVNVHLELVNASIVTERRGTVFEKTVSFYIFNVNDQMKRFCMSCHFQYFCCLNYCIVLIEVLHIYDVAGIWRV